MKEVILITGASGLIAKQLSKELAANYTIRLLTRTKERENEFEWNIEKGTLDEKSLIGVNHIIHLAGASVAGKRWTKERKYEILSSRVDSAKILLNALIKNDIKLKSFVSASAVGFYGSETTDKIFTEEDAKGIGFLSDVVFQWEQVADEFLKRNCAERVVKLRTGVVLAERGGALPKLRKPIDMYVGAALGSGKQYMPWIHIDDICACYAFAIREPKMTGVYNAVSPSAATNQEMTKMIANIIKKPILLPNIPSFIIKLIFGEAASILLEGSRVSAKKLTDSGFEFKYSDLRMALEDLLKR